MTAKSPLNRDADTAVPRPMPSGSARATRPRAGHLRIIEPDGNAAHSDGSDGKCAGAASVPSARAPNGASHSLPGSAIPAPAFGLSGPAFAAVLGAALAHVAIYTSSALYALRISNDPPRWSNGIFLAHAFGMALGVVALPGAWVLMNRHARGRGAGRMLAALPLALVLAAGWASRLPGLDAWEYGAFRSGLAAMGYGTVVSGLLMLFFAVVPPGRRGLWYGCGLSAGFLWWRITQYLTRGVKSAPEVADWYNTLFTVQTATILAMALLVGYGVAKLPPVRPSGPRVPVDRGRGRRLLGAIFLFYLANGFAGAKLFPAGPNQDNSPGLWQLHILVVIACPLFGLYLDRRRGGAKTLMLICSVFLMLAPTLDALSDSPLLYSVILSLATLAQFAMLIAAITVVAGLGTTPAWYGAAFLIQWLLRLVSMFGYFLCIKMPALGGGVSVLLATVTALGFHFAVRRIKDDFDEPAAPRSPAEGGADEAETIDGDGSLAAICRHHNLTPRECEVARLFAQGLGIEQIAQSLYISEHTAKTHLRNIMAKFAVSKRSALLFKMLQRK